MVAVAEDAEHFVLTAANTRVEAEVSAGPTFTLSFAKVSGTLDLLIADPTRSVLRVEVDMGSASSTPELVAEVAMSVEFLDAARHPTTVFASRQVSTTEDGAYEMVGELTLHGVTRGLRTPVSLVITNCQVDMDVAFSFDRHTFGIENDGSLESVVSDTVAVRFVLSLPRACKNTSLERRRKGVRLGP